MGWRDHQLHKKRFPVRVFFYQSEEKPEYYFVAVNNTGAYNKLGWYHISQIEKFGNFYWQFKDYETIHKKIFIFHDDIVGSILRYHGLVNPNPKNLKDQTADDEWIKQNKEEIIDFTK